MSWQKFVDAVYRMHQVAQECRRNTLHAAYSWRRRVHPFTDEHKARIDSWRPSLTKPADVACAEFEEYLRNRK